MPKAHKLQLLKSIVYNNIKLFHKRNIDPCLKNSLKLHNIHFYDSLYTIISLFYQLNIIIFITSIYNYLFTFLK